MEVGVKQKHWVGGESRSPEVWWGKQEHEGRGEAKLWGWRLLTEMKLGCSSLCQSGRQ